MQEILRKLILRIQILIFPGILSYSTDRAASIELGSYECIVKMLFEGKLIGKFSFGKFYNNFTYSKSAVFLQAPKFCRKAALNELG
jgi:hypothetical protein